MRAIMTADGPHPPLGVRVSYLIVFDDGSIEALTTEELAEMMPGHVALAGQSIANRKPFFADYHEAWKKAQAGQAALKPPPRSKK